MGHDDYQLDMLIQPKEIDKKLGKIVFEISVEVFFKNVGNKIKKGFII